MAATREDAWCCISRHKDRKRGDLTNRHGYYSGEDPTDRRMDSHVEIAEKGVESHHFRVRIPCESMTVLVTERFAGLSIPLGCLSTVSKLQMLERYASRFTYICKMCEGATVYVSVSVFECVSSCTLYNNDHQPLTPTKCTRER